MQTFATGWLLAGATCILGLAAYAASLWRRVWLAKQQREQQLSVQKKQRHEDLLVLANGFLSGQMPWAEGCIRIKVILDHYDAEMSTHSDYHVLQTVFSATQHIPSHDAWRQLSSAEKKPFQQLLAELELKHKQESIRAVQQLLTYLQAS